jgi:hypothetical protein
MGMVVRARFPGSKFDLCLVLEGRQGGGKSSLVRLLASGPGEGYFVDAPGLIAMDNKARAELLAGKWLVELAELSGMARSETEGVKAFLSQEVDHYRPPYASTAVDRPRRCLFVATTNAVTYLPDATGNRRFLPIPCTTIDLAALAAERDQLIAEADAVAHRILRRARASGQARYGQPLPHMLAARFALPPALWDEAAEIADQRRVVDPVEEALPHAVCMLEERAIQLPDGRKFITSADLLAQLRVTMNAQVRNTGLAGWMRSLGWNPHKYRQPGGGQKRGYAK